MTLPPARPRSAEMPPLHDSPPRASPPKLLAASRTACRAVVRQARSNFAASFWLLPSNQRQAMYALYAFARRCDDLGDGPEPLDQRRAALAAWRAELRAAWQGDARPPLWPAIVDAAREFGVPLGCFVDILDGVEMDLDIHRYPRWSDVEPYCRRVASAVGVACLHVWGFRDEAALVPAERCGLAFQWTNVLRDLREDAARGRIYLPLEDLRAFDCAEDDLARGVAGPGFAELLEFEIRRAERFYAEATPLEKHLPAPGRRMLRVMTAVYRGLLEKIRRAGPRALTERARLTTWEKCRLAAGALARWR